MLEGPPLFARVVPGGSMTVLALHGLGASHRYWGRSLDGLSPWATVVAVDPLGFGASPKPAGRYTFDRHLEAIDAVLDRHRLGSRMLVVGHSLGALLALAAASRWPQRVAVVLAVSLPAYRSPAEAREHLASLNPMARRWLRQPRLAHLVCAATRRSGKLGTSLAPFLAPELPVAVARDGLTHTWASFHGSLEALIEEADVRG